MKKINLGLFEGKQIRKIYNEKKEKWYFSVIDIVGILTEQSDYTKGLKENKSTAKKGGAVAKNARKELENKTGKSIVNGDNFLKPKKEKKLK